MENSGIKSRGQSFDTMIDMEKGVDIHGVITAELAHDPMMVRNFLTQRQ